MVKIYENKGEKTKVKMQVLEDEALCSPEFKSKSLQALKDNSLDSPIRSTTRMYEKLPECSVVLYRLTEEDLRKSYRSEYDYDVNYDVKRKADELCSRVDAMDTYKRKDGSVRSCRNISKCTASAFELYKQKRERYMNRKNRAYHSENSLDMSQDESRTFSDDAKPKKKLKRGRRYERDYEWRPDAAKGLETSSRKLRAHTSVIESDSSISDEDEDEFMYDVLMGFESTDGKKETASSNAVPSDVSTAALKYSELSKQSSDKYSFSDRNFSLSSELHSSSHKIDSISCDIVSDIIKSMDNQRPSTKLKLSLKHSTTNSNDLKKTEQKKRKRPRMLSPSNKNSESNPDKIIAVILKEIVSKVALKPILPKTNLKKSVICQWCATPFQPNRNSDIKCAICTDLGNGKVSKMSATSKKVGSSGKIKCLKESKVKKSNSALKNSVLKKLSENEKQRLIYAEKSDKTTTVKGYNHCKSFAVPKHASVNSVTDASQNKIKNKLSLKENKISLPSKEKNIESSVNINCDKTTVEASKPRISLSIKNNKSRVSLENVKDGLFLMTFPDPDAEIDFGDKFSQPLKENSQAVPESANNTNQSNTIESLLSTPKQSSTTYMLPPIPTVIVSSFCTNNVNSEAISIKLTDTFYQNAITHQHNIKNSTSLSGAVNSNADISQNNIISNAKNVVAPISSAVVYKSSLITNNLSSNSLPITSFPLSNNSLSQFTIKSVSTYKPERPVTNLTMLPTTSLSSGIMPVFSKTSVPMSNVPILPRTSISANNVTMLPKTSLPTSNVTILPIVTSVISLCGKNTVLQTDKVKENVPSSFSADNFVNSQLLDIKINNVTSLKIYDTQGQSSLNLEPISNKDFNKRLPSDSNIEHTLSENKSAKRKRLSTSDSSEISNRDDITRNLNVTDKNTASDYQPNLSEGDKSSGLTNNDQIEQQSLAAKQVDKSSSNKENASPQSAISATQSAIDLLGAISILAVIDLEKNPQTGLNVRIQLTKTQLNKLTGEKISTSEHSERIASCQYNLQLLNIAKKYLSLYGSFTKVSDHLLRKANMIQIKKELHEEETNQSSCMFSQSSNSNNSHSEISLTNNQRDNFGTSRSSVQSSISHIEKLQSQIAAMNNAHLAHYAAFPGGGTVHHYGTDQIAALGTAVAAPMPVTPRNDCLANEPRETPSRGSGPRTPARPESAASQSEDASMIQIKKEQLESIASPSSQCVYAQNTALPQISSHLPVMSDMSTLNMPPHSAATTTVNLPNNTNLVYSNQTNYSVHSGGMVSNRTVAYNNQQTYSDMYLNVAAKPQIQINPVASNAEITRQNQQVLLGQQMYIQNGSGLCPKQAVPSVNSNQYVIRPPYTSVNTGGTVIVNNTQVGQNALLTNVSNQQFYTSNQVSQLYYPPSSQMTCMPTNTTISNMITQEIAATQLQQAELESPEHMICAVCNKQATLRCKQCARVAYCNTACAKTYWHQKHKMECKPLGS